MTNNKLKKQMLMLAAAVYTGLSAHAMDPTDVVGTVAPGAAAPVMIAPAPQIALELADYQTPTVTQIATEMTAGLNADIRANGIFDLTDTSYSAQIARKLLNMNRDRMIATVAEILQGNEELLGISGQLFRWLNGDNVPGNTTGQDIWNRMANIDGEDELIVGSVAWFRNQIKNRAQLNITPINVDSYILALIGSNIKYLNFNSKKLTTVPIYMNQLTKMMVLYLNHNKIKTISAAAFTGCTALRELYLGRNQLITIANGAFATMHLLQTLNLMHNQLTIFPATILQLSSLQKLWASDCFASQLLASPEAFEPVAQSIRAVFDDPTVAVEIKHMVAKALIKHQREGNPLLMLGQALLAQLRTEFLPPAAHLLMMNLSILKFHTPTLSLAPLTTEDHLNYTSRPITQYLRTQLLGLDGRGGFFALYLANLGSDPQRITMDMINNVMHKLTVILNYNDDAPAPITDGYAWAFATDTPLQRTQITDWRIILHHVYRELRTRGLDQDTINDAWAELIVQSAHCPSGQMEGIETFARMLGIDVESRCFHPYTPGHEADRFWAPLYEFKIAMAEAAISATVARRIDGVVDINQYLLRFRILHNMIGLTTLYRHTPTIALEELEEGEVARLLQHFTRQFNFITICTYMMRIFNASPEARASLRAIPELARMFYQNEAFKRYAFGDVMPSDDDIYNGDTPITHAEMMLYVKTFLGHDRAFDAAERAIRMSGWLQIM